MRNFNRFKVFFRKVTLLPKLDWLKERLHLGPVGTGTDIVMKRNATNTYSFISVDG